MYPNYQFSPSGMNSCYLQSKTYEKAVSANETSSTNPQEGCSFNLNSPSLDSLPSKLNALEAPKKNRKRQFTHVYSGKRIRSLECPKRDINSENLTPLYENKEEEQNELAAPLWDNLNSNYEIGPNFSFELINKTQKEMQKLIEERDNLSRHIEILATFEPCLSTEILKTPTEQIYGLNHLAHITKYLKMACGLTQKLTENFLLTDAKNNLLKLVHVKIVGGQEKRFIEVENLNEVNKIIFHKELYESDARRIARRTQNSSSNQPIKHDKILFPMLPQIIEAINKSKKTPIDIVTEMQIKGLINPSDNWIVSLSRLLYKYGLENTHFTTDSKSYNRLTKQQNERRKKLIEKIKSDNQLPLKKDV